MNGTISFSISNPTHLNLFVEKRIRVEDAVRQTKTAQEIDRRFMLQPGLILADEVGMGKTFVALAVAAAAHFNDPKRNPVVVMVPPALAHKWPNDAGVFQEHCLQSPWREQFRFNKEPIESGIDFLKTLDEDGVSRQHYSVVFITHGALYRSLSDNWVKLAILRRALHGKHDIDDIRRALGRFAGSLLRMKRKVPDEAWEGLLSRDPDAWLTYLNRHFPEAVPEDKDDPVPANLWEAIQEPELRPVLDKIRDHLKEIPRRESKYVNKNINDLRLQLKDEISDLWKLVKGRLRLRLPLLIFDEAHHLKNPKTQLVRSLFKSGQEDTEGINGAFHGVFSKMLFMTATPFQLGHYELVNVLRHFQSVAWDKQAEGALNKENYDKKLHELSNALDGAQEEAMRLDQAWGRLTKEDNFLNILTEVDEEIGHNLDQFEDKVLPDRLRAALKQAQATEAKMRAAEILLRPWVLRHLKPRYMRQKDSIILRRKTWPGKGILDSTIIHQGLEVEGNAVLPFLLAARTVAVNPSGRAVYAEGLASSYEAFLNTHKNRSAGLDDDDDFTDSAENPKTLWYADAIHKALTDHGQNQFSGGHPKVEATTRKVMALWESGEKVVVFCHYIETGRALRLAISRTIHGRILDLAMAKLPGSSRKETEERLEDIGQKFFDSEGQVRRHFDNQVGGFADQYGAVLSEHKGKIVDIMRRFVRTPAYLSRFFPLDTTLGLAEIDAALFTKDASGITLRQLFESFLEFLAVRCNLKERIEYLNAVDGVQTGSHRVSSAAYLAGEDLARAGEGVLPNVRLVNGTTKPEARRKLMLTFNTPFYPEVLIASAVLAEGVDLHLNCRFVIHHDLCWNPSTLEQRTGRVDRIGAKAERSHRPIEIYLPYIGGTQDEKMYRVVMDRERWFKVVMGEDMKTDSASVEKQAERIPLPLSLAEKLAFKLDV